jgi:hypothetical protein
MKTKTIEHLCRRAMEGWVASLPAELQEPAQDDLILTGGSIASLFLGEPVNDWDVYFRTRATAKLVAEHYVGQFVASPPPTLEGNPLLKQVQVVERGERVAVMVQSAGILTEHSGQGSYHYFEALTDASPEQAEQYLQVILGGVDGRSSYAKDKDYWPVAITGNAITLARQNRQAASVQLILRFTGDPAQIHKNFDWRHATNYWTFRDGLRTNSEALECLLSRELRYVGSQYPLAALLRSFKFVGRGFTRPHAGHLLVLSLQLARLDWDDPRVWEEQLMGVDFAYFREIIERIRALLKEGKGMQEIIATYLAQIVEETI